MKNITNIALLATQTTDKIIQNNKIAKQEGGPFLFITRVFNDNKINYEILNNPHYTIEIKITKKGEIGRVVEKIIPIQIDYKKILQKNLVISSVMNEFSLKNIDQYNGNIFLDIQGYVRDKNKFGKKKIFKPDKNIQNSFFCIKTNKKETPYLPKSFIKIQKKKLLIISKGKDGCTLYIKNKKYELQTPENKRINLKETIGAGDTLFANFISQYILNPDPIKNIKYAMEKAVTFLQNR